MKIFNKKIVWVIEFEDDIYEFQSDMMGRELLLKNGEAIDRKFNFRTNGRYTIESKSRGPCDLVFSYNYTDIAYTIRIHRDEKIIAEYTKSVVHSMPKWCQDDPEERKKSVEQRRKSARIKVGVTLISLVLSMIALALIYSWTVSFFLISVLLLHEAGHYAVMWKAGYRNMHMIFAAPFGAAVTGHKPESSEWERFWVFIAGPLPGIILAFSLVAAFGMPERGTFVFNMVLILLAFNYFNLLPLPPLDGGRIFDLMFLQKFPGLQILFAGAGVIAFVFLSIVYRDILIGLFALLTLSLFMHRIRQYLKPSEPQAGAHTTQFERPNGEKARWHQRLIAAFIYFGTWTVGLVLLMSTISARQRWDVFHLQLENFERHVVIEDGDGFRMRFTEPVLTPRDLKEYFQKIVPGVTLKPDAEVFSIRYKKSHSDSRDFDILYQWSFVGGRLSQIEVSRNVSVLLSSAHLLSCSIPLREGVKPPSYTATWNIPALQDLIRNLGAAVETKVENLQISHIWRYSVVPESGFNSQDGQAPNAHIMIVVQTDTDRITRIEADCLAVKFNSVINYDEEPAGPTSQTPGD